MRHHYRLYLAKLNPVAARLNHVVFATNKQIVAPLIEAHPVASAGEIFFAAGSKGIANKAGCTLLGPPVVALHHYGTSSVEKSFLSWLRDSSASRIDGDQGGTGT